jgi:hypothetical protein
MLDAYCRHVTATDTGTAADAAGPSALLGLLGLYRVRLLSGASQYVVAMRDVLPSAHYASRGGGSGSGTATGMATRVFDVKGSLVGRRAVNKTSVHCRLCYAMLCYAMLCCAMLCYAML